MIKLLGTDRRKSHEDLVTWIAGPDFAGVVAMSEDTDAALAAVHHAMSWRTHDVLRHWKSF